ncbi:MAG TPA: glutathione S-transferase family protein [Alphaproteobacteria bacterium]|jgi:glutathione S-transferase|nr:glutathione S-transferase family protein [Micavibrio sp.]MBK9562611.1 glutathione S-transferase family protein [Micavibrio sp.]MBP7721098.1 glutathione S-transferase family protein [Alphaproteobacteria bacterium]HQX26311.1 glutathione S-transferase family protein [Alphaproteobacteria bacterium]
MRTLFHLWLHPFSRKVRVALTEKKLDFELQIEKVWERRTEFLALNPAGDVPVLIEKDGTTLANSQVICEYLEEVYPEVNLLGHDPVQRAETRRLVSWFDVKFNREVTDNLIGEKLMKQFLKTGEPHAPAVRAGHANIHYHLDYIGFLTEKRKWLAGDNFSLADIAAAAHLSAIDYIGDVPWEEHEAAREWYAKMKSRPSFKPLLDDRIPGFTPSSHYEDIDS